MLLRNLSVRSKLIVGFLAIIFINGLSGVFGLQVINDLGKLVYKTYDEALMSGTFAQASKFDFAQYNLEVQEALLATDEKDFRRHKRLSERHAETLEEDLEVVRERSLSPESGKLLMRVKSAALKSRELEKRLFEEKEKKLRLGQGIEGGLKLRSEWAENLSTKKLYKALTALYDDAAEVGYMFRLNSETQNQENYRRTIAIIGVSLLLSLVLSVWLSIQIIRPLFSLDEDSRKVAEGDFSIRSKLSRADEFGILANSFNYMLDNIQEKKESMETLLTALPFALFYFQESGEIAAERSDATGKLFKDFASTLTLEDFFNHYGDGFPQTSEVLRAMFQRLLPFKSAASLLPQRVIVKTESGERMIDLFYKPKLIGKKLESVIVLGEDVTEKNRAIREEQRLAERVERLSKVSIDIPGYTEFKKTARGLFVSIERGGQEVEIKRNLHSLKGLLGIYSFNSLAAKIHGIEDLENLDDRPKLLAAARNVFEEQTEDIDEILALDEDEHLKFYDQRKIAKLLKKLEENKDVELLKVAETLNRFPIDKALAKYLRHSRDIVQRMGDKEVDLVFAPSDEVSFEEMKRLDEVFVHVLNNSIDHGIETISEREEKNKSRKGEIRISCERLPSKGLRLIISDDGKGIDEDTLVKKAIDRGLVTESDASSFSKSEKLNLIFAAGLSTKDTASMISGRGVGMDAVKAHLNSLGGEIHLDSQVDKGTSFEIIVPPLEAT